jgi:hypothetical protein
MTDDSTTSRRGFLTGALSAGTAAAVAAASGVAQAKQGFTGQDRAVELFNAAGFGGDLGEIEVVVPKPILKLLDQPHQTPSRHQSAAAIAHKVAEVMGFKELANDIKAGITSTHFSGRLTPAQIKDMKLDEKYDRPELYTVKVREPGGNWNSISVNLENFEHIGTAMEAIRHLQNAREQDGHVKLCTVQSDDMVKSIGKPSGGISR